MKTVSLLLVLLVGSLTTNIQDQVTRKAVYDGYFEGIYSFTSEGGDDYVEETIEFENVSETILKEFDLQTSNYDGNYFSITYTVSTETVENEYGEEEELVTYTLVKAKKL